MADWSNNAWNVLETRPGPVNEQGITEAYIEQSDRSLPQNWPGWQTRDRDRFTYPYPSYLATGEMRLFNCMPVTWDQLEWFAEPAVVYGDSRTLDFPSVRQNNYTTEDGLPLNDPEAGDNIRNEAEITVADQQRRRKNAEDIFRNPPKRARIEGPGIRNDDAGAVAGGGGALMNMLRALMGGGAAGGGGGGRRHGGSPSPSRTDLTSTLPTESGSRRSPTVSPAPTVTPELTASPAPTVYSGRKTGGNPFGALDGSEKKEDESEKKSDKSQHTIRTVYNSQSAADAIRTGAKVAKAAVNWQIIQNQEQKRRLEAFKKLGQGAKVDPTEDEKIAKQMKPLKDKPSVAAVLNHASGVISTVGETLQATNSFGDPETVNFEQEEKNLNSVFSMPSRAELFPGIEETEPVKMFHALPNALVRLLLHNANYFVHNDSEKARYHRKRLYNLITALRGRIFTGSLDVTKQVMHLMNEFTVGPKEYMEVPDFLASRQLNNIYVSNVKQLGMDKLYEKKKRRLLDELATHAEDYKEEMGLMNDFTSFLQGKKTSEDFLPSFLELQALLQRTPEAINDLLTAAIYTDDDVQFMTKGIKSKGGTVPTGPVAPPEATGADSVAVPGGFMSAAPKQPAVSAPKPLLVS